MTEFIINKDSIFYVAEENNDLLNKNKFSRIILEYFNENLNFNFEYWDDLFKYIAQKEINEKLVVVIDELPYVALANSTFLSTLQNVIDHHLIFKKILLILCGSSISFMENELVAHKSPIYGRKTGQMKLLPLDYYD